MDAASKILGSRDAAQQLANQLGILNQTKAEPKVTTEASLAFAAMAAVRRGLAALDGSTATTYVKTIHTTQVRPGTSVVEPHAAIPGGADGMTVPGRRFPYEDKMLLMAAPGEEIISNRHGQADRFRADRAAGRIPGYAEGGTAGGVLSTYVRRQGSDGPPNRQGDRVDDTIQLFVAGAWSAAKALKAMKDEVEKTEKALDREKTKLEQLTSQRDSLSSSVTGSLLHDPFGNGLAGFETQNAADAADSTAMLAALQTLVKNGLDPKGALFQALAASGDVNTAQQMAALTSSQLFAEQASFNQTHTLASATGQFAGTEAFGSLVSDTQKAVNEFRQEVRHLRRELNQLGKNVKDGAQEGSHTGTHQGVKDANEGRDRSTASLTRTG